MTLEEKAKQAAAMLKAEKTKKPESKDAGSDSSSGKEKIEDKGKEKAEAKKEAPDAETLAKEAEIKAKKDEEILSKKDEELDDDGKKRKAELVKIEAADKDKKEKSNVQKRFDELTSKIKILESDKEATKAEKDELKAELDGIKKKLSMTPDDKFKETLKGKMVERRQKFLEEDKELPNEERREMPKGDLDEWLLEDYEAASEWITRRSLRRVREEEAFREDDTLTRKANAILDKQLKSAERTYAKHPELDIHARQMQLVKEGKSKQEIFDTLCKEVPKYKLGAEILKENPEKYMLAENGPELIVAEIEKRLEKKPAENNTEIEELKKKLAEKEAEVEQLKNLDTSVTGDRHDEPLKTKTELDKKREELAVKVGLTPERIAKAVKRRVDKGYDG